MITAIVRIKGSRPFTDEEVREIFDGTAPNYVAIPGLIRKYYILSPDRMIIGGVYLWETKEQGEAIYTDEWREYVVSRYKGEAPVVEYYDSNIVVDNAKGGEIETYWDNER